MASATRDLSIEHMPIALIKGATRNPKDHDIPALQASLRTHGFVAPLVLDERSGRLVAGHGRLEALRGLLSAGEDPPAGVLPEGDDWLVPVVRGVRFANPKAAEAYLLADNRLTEIGGWNDTELLEVLRDMQAADMLEQTAFTDDDLLDLLAAIDGPPIEDDRDPDVIPEVPKKAKTKLGDIYVLGDHRIMCGDSRDPSDVAKLIDRPINLAFTSPPYASQREYDQASGFMPVAPDDYVEWFAPVAAVISKHLAPDGSWFVNIKPSSDGPDTQLYVMDLVLAHVREWGWHFATEFCWERNGVPKSVTQRFKNQFEPIYQFTKGRWKMRPDAVRHESDNVPTSGGPGVGATTWKDSQGGNGEFFGAAKWSPTNQVGGTGGVDQGSLRPRKGGTSQLMSDSQGHNTAPGIYIGPGLAYPGNRLPTFASSHTATGHTAAFPVGLPEFFVNAYTDPGDTVYDPFMGSGSTLLACERTGRAGYGMEISPHYVDVIVQRWEDFTGQKATRS